jgi:hypothetical protein
MLVEPAVDSVARILQKRLNHQLSLPS